MDSGGAHSTRTRPGARQTHGAGTGTVNERLARVEEKTKHTATKADMEHLRTDMTKSIGELRSDTTKSIGDLRTEMKDSIGDLRTEMKDSIGELREDTQASTLKLTKSIGDLRTDMEKSTGDIKASNNTQLKWLLGVMIPATIAIVVSVMKG